MARFEADENLPYFCTITVLDWLPVLIEARYIHPIIESLRFCRKRKGLGVHAYVVMAHHVHPIASAGEKLHEIMRDFKRFTSRTIHDRLKEDGRGTLLDRLKVATERARRQQRDELGLWRCGFHPQAIYPRPVLDQTLGYLHANPVRKGRVARPEDWWYSSAGFYSGAADYCMEVEPVDL